MPRSDQLLLVIAVCWFVSVFGLSITTAAAGGPPQLLVLFEGAFDNTSYPRVDQVLPPAEGALQIDDEVVSIDEVDLRGAKTLNALSVLASESLDGHITVRLKRQGLVHTANAAVPPHPNRWAMLLISLTFGICGVLAFLGTPPGAVTKWFFIAAMGHGANAALFYGLTAELSQLAFLQMGVAAVIYGGFAFKFLAVFPSQPLPDRLFSQLWPWLLAGTMVVFAWSELTNLPLRALDVAIARPVGLLVGSMVVFWLLTRNYRAADLAGRKQLRWVMLASYVLGVSISIGALITIWDPAMQPWLHALNALVVIFPISWLVAIIGNHALEVNRVIAAVVSSTVALTMILLAIILACLPLSQFILRESSLNPQIVYISVALVVCGSLLPIHRFLKSHIERWFFKERYQLAARAQRLISSIERCESENELLELLSAGLAKTIGAEAAHLSPQVDAPAAAYTLMLEPSLGEAVYIHLEQKASGDHYRDEDHRVIGDIGAHAERSLLKLRNEALRIERTAAEQLARDKSLFLATASHDLRQPMHALSLFAESLAVRNREPSLTKLINQLQRSSSSLIGMFNSILDVSKLDAGIMQPEPRSVALQVLFEELHTEFAATAEGKGLTLSVVPTSLLVHSDPQLLIRMLRNLVTNAIRYTPIGRVLIGCRYGSERARVQVIDTGIGISEADRADIFDPYIRANHRSDDGLGLGLSVVSKIATILDHRVSLVSSPRGSCFTIEVPIAASQLPRGLDQDQHASVADLRGIKVVAIDDDAAIRIALKDLLSLWHCDVEVYDSVEAVETWLNTSPEAPDVLLVDLHVKNANEGERIIERVWHVLQPLPALLITGDASAGISRRVSGRAVAVLSKPLEPAQLRNSIGALLEP